MNALLIDSGVDTHADLLGLFPAEIRSHITPQMLNNSMTAAALRVLADVHRAEWHAHVKNGFIDWQPIVTWARNRSIRLGNETRAALEIAASLDGYPHAHVNLLYAVQVMSENRFLTVMDALRIAKQGVSK